MAEHRTDAEEDVASLVRAARDGDPRAMERLVALHLPLIYGIVGRALNGHTDTDDLVQETMVRIVRGLPKLREPERFRSWAVAIAYREIQQHQRRAGGENPARHDVESVPDPLPDFAERTVAELALTGQRRHLARATRWLEPADRQLLALYWEEASGRLTRSELAASLGLDRRHTAVRVQRMKERLEAARTLVHALSATPRCPGLASEAREWDGVSGALWRKRLSRHVRDCPQCHAHQNGLVTPENLLPGIGLVAVPGVLLVWLRETAAAAASTAPSLLGRLREPLTLAGSKAKAAAVVAAAGGAAGTLALLLWQSPAGPPSAAPTPRTTAPARAGTAPAPSSGNDVTALTLYVAPDGSDGGDGSLSRPLATLGKAVGLVRPGGTILMRGGTYRPTEAVDITTDADADHRITLANYPGEQPVVDASGIARGSWAVTQTADYWTVRGLEIHGSTSHAYVCRGCAHTVFQDLSFHDNAESGLTLRDGGTVANSVLDSDFYANHGTDDHGRSGVGLAIKFGSGAGNLVRGCRTYDNADDGLDLGGFTSPVTVESNWSFGNGVNRWRDTDWQGNGNGFTLGGGNTRAAVAHVVRNNAAWENTGLGFNDEGNPGRISLTRNTAYRNGVDGFHLTTTAAAARANVAVANGRDAALGDQVSSTDNTWDGGATDATVFVSTDEDSARAPRSADGALPRTDFLAPRGGAATAAGATMTAS
ncbi:sigma-70 family RNA polymerase sigma factor [Streptomyces sp. NBC_00102]|uniref:sigma-70 family RNA polymerase sigma factor n=1 Tax=Streptomyces sp. NBC_00102 TaxID=2975652 RepID=UPI00225ACC3D|nr:sigma-70 family RNA polymerase sigma factor [Streptomyces sp. NBC_00102]MCX5402056.1 sigma-70 family RNA polymerase sigma factor [Streptomyces sp. NBC_00102]